MAIDKQRGELLFDAISQSDFSKIVEEINSGLNINDKLIDGETLLHKSFLFKNVKITEHLILSGAKLFERNKTMRTPLHIGAANGFFEGCELYTLLSTNLNQQDHKGRIPLMHAIKFRQKTIIKLLMGNGSDTNLEDNNGYSALMWAIKFLNPDELKEIFSEDDEKVLEEQLESFIEDEKEVQVADTSIEEFEESFSKSLDDDNHQYVMPNPLREMLGKKKSNGEEPISYSISDHIESLKQKAKEQSAFDYNIHESIDSSAKEEVDGSIYDTENTESTTDKNIDSFSRQIRKEESDHKDKDQADTETEDYERGSNEDLNDNSDHQEADIIRVSGSKSSKEDKDEIIKIEKNSSPVGLKENEVMRVSGSSPDIIKENETTKVRSSSSDTLSDPNQETDSIRITSNADMKKEEKKQIRIKSNGESSDENEEQEIKRTDVNPEDTIDYANEIQKFKKIDGAKIDDDLYATEVKGQNQVKEEKQIIKGASNTENIDKESTQVSDGARVILERKKDVTYLKDGYKEVYKDEYGEIKSVDKTIEGDELSEIKETDKNLTPEQISQIKKVDKTVRSESEIKFLDAEEMERANNIEEVNLEGKISYEEVDGYSNKAPKKIQQETSTNQRIKRQDVETFQEEVFQGDITQKQDAKPDSDILGVAKGSNEFDDKGKGDFKLKRLDSHKDEEGNALDEVKETTSTTQDIEEKNISESHDTSEEETQETDPELSPAENKLLQAMSDPDHKNKKGQSLCWLAAFNGQVALLKKLVHKGANYEIKDPQGVSPLMAAAMKGRDEIVDYLVHKVRSVDEKRSDGQTALSLAIQYDQDQIVKTLANNGANTDTKIKGNTLLMHAAENNAVKCINTLIMLGADPLEKNIRGKTALEIAKIKKKKQAYVLIAKIMKARLKKSVEDASLEDEE